jgi:hypothetical protein
MDMKRKRKPESAKERMKLVENSAETIVNYIKDTEGMVWQVTKGSQSFFMQAII